MEAQLEHLTHIQEIDNQISEVMIHKNVYPKKIKELNARLKEVRGAIDTLKDSIDENAKECKKLQDQVTIEKERIERVEGKLPRIKTNKEYQALVKEMDNMRKEIARCEDTILNLLEEDESFKSDLAEMEKSFADEEKEIISKVSLYQDEMNLFDDKISKFEREKLVHTRSVDNQHIKTYERIKSRREGIAIVAAVKGVCQGCYMNIPPQLFNLIQRSDDINTCPNCNRILYFRGEQ